jgi:PAS domain S-box-containing protein
MTIPHYSILILDDSPEDILLYRRYLSQDRCATYDVVEIETGLKGLIYLAQNKPDLILLNYKLPDLNCLEFLNQLREQFDSWQIPVMILTGQEAETLAVEAMKNGALDYIVKSKLTSAGLCRAVNTALEKTRLTLQLKMQAQQQQLLAEILLRIRQFLSLEEILSAAVTEVRKFLQADRVIVYQFDHQMNGKIVAESLLPQWITSLNCQIQDTCFQENQGIAYRDGKIRAISDIYHAGLTACHIDLLEQFEVKANLVVPILLNTKARDQGTTSHQLWGLLIAHQCSRTREWERHELELLQQISVHLAVAIKQAELFKHLQTLNTSLEEKIQERTKELQASEQRFRAIFDNTFQCVGLLTTEGILLEANQTALNFGGIQLEDVINKPFWEADWWKASPSTQERLKTAIAHAAQGEFIRYEVDILGVGGQIATIDFSIRPLKNESGKVVMLISEGRDITESKQSKATLQLQAQILNEIHDAVVSIDVNGMIQTWNQGAQQLYGYKETEAIGQHIGLVYFPEDLAKLPTLIIEQLLKNRSLETEVRTRTKAGEEIYINLRLSVMTDQHDNIIRLIGCSNNISERKKAEKALQESQILLQVVMDSLPIAIFWKDRNSRYLGCNRQLMLDAGLSSIEEIIGKTDFDMVWREQAPLYQADDRIVMESGQPKFNIEEPFTKSGNLQRWLRTNKMPLYNADGAIIGVVASYEDITERKQTEQERDRLLQTFEQQNQTLEAQVAQRTVELQQSKERFRNLVETSSDWIWEINKFGVYTYASPQIINVLGYSPEEVLGKTPFDLMPPAEAAKVLDKFMQFIPVQAPFQCLENTNYHKDGRLIILETSGVPIFDADRQFCGYRGMDRDITIRKQAEQELRNLSDRLDLAIKSAQIGIWDWDIVNDRLVWDNRMYELFGVSPMSCDLSQEAWAQFVQIIHPDEQVILYETVQQVITQDQELDTEFRIILPDGKIRIIKAYGLVQRNSQGQPQRLIGINYDISDRKLAEAQLQQTNEQLAASNAELARATRLKDEFLANMSHELRTPLNAVLGISEALQQGVFGVINEKQRQSLQIIERSGNHLLALINDILDLSKIEAGQMKLNYTPIAISRLCQSSLAFIKQQAYQKRLQLELKIQPHLPKLLLDERRICQVLINLLNNAVKFTPEGGQITLEVTCQRLAPETEMTSQPDCIRFAVIDTGIGIAPDNIHKLFQPFIQIDSAFNRQYAGTGLGLALVRRLVELHGGRVGVSSELGVGSCFTVDLPCTQSDSSPELVNVGSPDANSTFQATAEYSPLILLAEDNEANIFSISSYLEAMGYRIILAKNGQDAIALVKAQVPDLILMDIQMPGMDGLEVIKQIRLDQNFADIAIVVLTALAMPGDREKCLVSGANNYLTKPVQLKQLATIIQQLLTTKDKRK